MSNAFLPPNELPLPAPPPAPLALQTAESAIDHALYDCTTREISLDPIISLINAGTLQPIYHRRIHSLLQVTKQTRSDDPLYLATVERLALNCCSTGWLLHLIDLELDLVEFETENGTTNGISGAEAARDMQERDLIKTMVEAMEHNMNILKRWLSSLRNDSQVVGGFEARVDPSSIIFPSPVIVLGQGGFGIVLKAMDRDTGEELAVKVPLGRSLNEINAALEDVNREASMIKRLQPCPHLVHLKGVSRIPKGFRDVVVMIQGERKEIGLAGRPCLVMELKGRSLKNVLDSAGAGMEPLVPWRIRIKIARDIACAISYMHACDILHLDLKPGNILIDRFWNARLCDFGASATVSMLQDPTFKPIYTPAYAPPSFKSSGIATPFNDIFALGQVLKDILESGNPSPSTNPTANATADDVVLLLARMYVDYDAWDENAKATLKGLKSKTTMSKTGLADSADISISGALTGKFSSAAKRRLGKIGGGTVSGRSSPGLSSSGVSEIVGKSNMQESGVGVGADLVTPLNSMAEFAFVDSSARFNSVLPTYTVPFQPILEPTPNISMNAEPVFVASEPKQEKNQANIHVKPYGNIVVENLVDAEISHVAAHSLPRPIISQHDDKTVSKEPTTFPRSRRQEASSTKDLTSGNLRPQQLNLPSVGLISRTSSEIELDKATDKEKLFYKQPSNLDLNPSPQPMSRVPSSSKLDLLNSTKPLTDFNKLSVDNDQNSKPSRKISNLESKDLIKSLFQKACKGDVDSFNALLTFLSTPKSLTSSESKFIYLLFRDTAKTFEQPTESSKPSAEEDKTAIGTTFYLVAGCYRDGIGVPVTPKKAFEWFTKSARAGHLQAKFETALCLERGSGGDADGHKEEEDDVTEIDHAKAFKWFLKAAEGGDQRALYEVASSYEIGRGVEKDISKAFKLFKQLAEEGNEWAQIKVADMYKTGNGAPTMDSHKAFDWYLKAVHNTNNAQAKNAIGLLLQAGIGHSILKSFITTHPSFIETTFGTPNPSPSPDHAYLWFLFSSKDMYPPSFCNLGLCQLKSTNGSPTPPSIATALESFESGSHLNDPDSQIQLALLHLSSKFPNPEKAFSLFEKAAVNSNHPIAMYNLGLCYRDGVGTSVNPKLAFKYLLESATESPSNPSPPPASFNTIGSCYESGFGIDKDPSIAIKWYRKSAELGNNWGILNLGLCYLKGVGTKIDFDRGFYWVKKSAEESIDSGIYNVRAMYELGNCYECAIGTDRDLEKAGKWYRNAARGNSSSSASSPDSTANGYVKAMYALGRCLEKGMGCDKNLGDAMRWYKLAAEKGSDDAESRLRHLESKGIKI
ncbi:hypothetical protein HDU76_006137 [Blyttiomyces sp. JEL0837]|nr:hypothetical protein HDU76_006137 [Blyttiomyces sp. JEL0837]